MNLEGINELRDPHGQQNLKMLRSLNRRKGIKKVFT